MKLQNILIGLVLVGLFATLFVGFVNEGNKNYDFNYNDTDLSSFQRVDDISDNANETMENLKKVYSNPGFSFDKVYAFYGGGVGAIKTILSSVAFGSDIVIEGTSKIPMSNSGILKTAFVVIFIIIIIVMLMKVMLKWDV